MNYYNENDPKAAATLRELIKQGHIANGDVDERGIEDVVPTDLVGYTQCHFFAGYGIWSLAFRIAGWPDSRPVWSGSCPCQPFSAAGKGGGFDDERHLWPAWFHLIQHAKRPGVPVYGEQVASPDGLAWLDLVWSDLEAENHTVRPFDLCCAGFGAPIIRQRTFWVASTTRCGRGEEHSQRSGSDGRDCAEGFPARFDSSRDDGGMASTKLRGSETGQLDRQSLERGNQRWNHSANDEPAASLICTTGGLAGSASLRRERRRSSEEIPASRPVERLERCGDAGGLEFTSSARSLPSPYAGVHRGEEGIGPRDAESERHGTDGRMAWANGGDTSAEGLQRGGQHGLIASDSGTCDEYRGTGPTNGFWRHADWLRCRDDKWRPVEPGTFPLAHGYPERVGLLRGAGNAISPKVAAYFIKAHLESEERGID